jgi:hypothetical protein
MENLLLLLLLRLMHYAKNSCLALSLSLLKKTISILLLDNDALGYSHSAQQFLVNLYILFKKKITFFYFIFVSLSIILIYFNVQYLNVIFLFILYSFLTIIY